MPLNEGVGVGDLTIVYRLPSLWVD